MPKERYHPNAYLAEFRNVKLGLKARTAILNVLERDVAETKVIARDADLPYGVVMHHLKLLEAKGIVQRKGGRPYVWRLTGFGQRRL